jgi:hypothetical protein
MQTISTHPTDRSVEPHALDRHIAELCRDAANEVASDRHCDRSVKPGSFGNPLGRNRARDRLAFLAVGEPTLLN